MNEPVRIDKWLWAVRIFKTRSQATEACRKGQVQVNDQVIKPSHLVKPDDWIKVRKNPIVYTYFVKALISNRISAKLVKDYLVNHTPEDEINKLSSRASKAFYYRERGLGRPTKKERRQMDEFFNNNEI